METYKVFYNKRTAEVQACDMYQAKLEAIKVFKPRKSQEHMISVVHLAPEGKQPMPYQLF